MSLPRSATVTWSAVGFAIAAWVVALWLIYSGPLSAPPIPLDGFIWATPFLVFAAIGGLITVRKPGHRVGWLLLGISLLQGTGLFAASLLRYAHAANAGLGAVSWLDLLANS
ncbi:MAG TPA: hypothetical protein VLR46_15185, partial [Candidatus Dormibacteraeota bacterium]|nr:hypothetical protein [Candidatus Dormibacteraeota bacterium]